MVQDQLGKCKADRAVCSCGDLCKLNRVLQFDAYPIPYIDKFLHRLCAAPVYLTLELTKGCSHCQIQAYTPSSSFGRRGAAFRPHILHPVSCELKERWGEGSSVRERKKTGYLVPRHAIIWFSASWEAIRHDRQWYWTPCGRLQRLPFLGGWQPHLRLPGNRSNTADPPTAVRALRQHVPHPSWVLAPL